MRNAEIFVRKDINNNLNTMFIEEKNTKTTYK